MCTKNEKLKLINQHLHISRFLRAFGKTTITWKTFSETKQTRRVKSTWQFAANNAISADGYRRITPNYKQKQDQITWKKYIIFYIKDKESCQEKWKKKRFWKMSLDKFRRVSFIKQKCPCLMVAKKKLFPFYVHALLNHWTKFGSKWLYLRHFL